MGCPSPRAQIPESASEQMWSEDGAHLVCSRLPIHLLIFLVLVKIADLQLCGHKVALPSVSVRGIDFLIYATSQRTWPVSQGRFELILQGLFGAFSPRLSCLSCHLPSCSGLLSWLVRLPYLASFPAFLVCSLCLALLLLFRVGHTLTLPASTVLCAPLL